MSERVGLLVVTMKHKKKILGISVILILVVVGVIYYSKVSPVKETNVYLSVYEKIEAEVPVNVLIVGDSIAQGTGATPGNSWATLFTNWIKEKCGEDSVITNISMGGNTSYAGIVRENILDDDIDYDLAIICYGENDVDDDSFAPTYEGIIRGLKSKYGQCDIICILESSQREYTNKMNQIIDIAEYYNLPIADTIAAFNESGYKYEELVGAPDDLTHPNDLGHYIYFQTVQNVIETQIKKISVYSQSSTEYDSFLYYSKSDFKRIGLNKYRIDIEEPITADIGIYRNYVSGENGLKIYVDDELIIDQNFDWNYSFTQAHIDKLTQEPAYIERSIVLEFSSTEQAQNFDGIVLSNIAKGQNKQ